MIRPSLAAALTVGFVALALSSTSALAYEVALAETPAAVAAATPRSAVTSPEEAFGHAVGADYHLVNYTQWEAYLKTLASQSDRMKLVEIGKSS